MSEPQQPTTTLFLGNLADRVSREVLYEIGIQAGPVASVNLPTDQTSHKHRGFGFLVSALDFNLI